MLLSSLLWLSFCAYASFLATLLDEKHSSTSEIMLMPLPSVSLQQQESDYTIHRMLCICSPVHLKNAQIFCFCLNNLMRKLSSDSLQLIINNLRITFCLYKEFDCTELPLFYWLGHFEGEVLCLTPS